MSQSNCKAALPKYNLFLLMCRLFVSKLRAKTAKGHRPRLILPLLLLFLSHGAIQASDGLVPLASPGPWSAVSALIGYQGRVWFVNSVKFVDHNSADIYSYDPIRGTTRYERHLFSQDAGQPAVAGGLLYWPFEDPRFSAGRGEYMVTNGRDWRWRILPEGEVFHIHAMLAHRGTLYAATSAWRAGVQRSKDGLTWEVIYDHPTPSRSVTRITTLAALGEMLYAGLTDYRREGAKLLRWDGTTFRPVRGWPAGQMVTSLAAYGRWLYGVNVAEEESAVWRTNGRAVERIARLDGHQVHDLEAGPNAVWAVSENGKGGVLWRSGDGLNWKAEQYFDNARPLDVLVYGNKVYVGTEGPDGKGTLWGPPAPSTGEREVAALPLASPAYSLPPDRLRDELGRLGYVLSDRSSYADGGRRVREALQRLALSGNSEVGKALAARLKAPFPDVNLKLFGEQLTVSAATFARWYLLWAMALTGHGTVPPEFISIPFQEKPNRAQKFLHLGSAAAWAVEQIGQRDDETISALIDALGRPRYPRWLDGDYVGALTALTGERLGYDVAAWRAWWARTKESFHRSMIEVPAGTLLMGSDNGEAAENPVHRVVLSAFSIDRFETTNQEFTGFVKATGYRTSVEASGMSWHWEGVWKEVKGADWRHPRGPSSSIEGFENHPVVQVSWIDAQAYCHWRGKRLPTEAEWERAARGDGGRTYPWGNEPPHEGKRYRASYGSDQCCQADLGDGYLFTAPVGSLPLGRSPFGVEDMAGNVWEWVEDWFDPNFYRRAPEANPVNRIPGERKVIRGGGWGNNPWGLRSTLRHANPPDIGLSMVGFRCAR